VDPGALLEFQETHAGMQAHESAEPSDHHRHEPQSAVQMLEAQWGLHDHLQNCQTTVKVSEVNEAMKDFPGWTQEADSKKFAHSFGMNSDAIPTDMERPFDDAKDALAASMNVDPTCVKLVMVPAASNGWEFTNHAILLTGWGSDDEGRAYWVVQNSWGPGWGDRGYGFAPRGIDYGGLDSQVVFATVDQEEGYFKHKLEEQLDLHRKRQSAKEGAHKEPLAAEVSPTGAGFSTPMLLEIDSAADVEIDSAVDATRADATQDEQKLVEPIMSRLFSPPLRHPSTIPLVRDRPDMKDVRPVREQDANDLSAAA